MQLALKRKNELKKTDWLYEARVLKNKMFRDFHLQGNGRNQPVKRLGHPISSHIKTSPVHHLEHRTTERDVPGETKNTFN